MGDIPVKVVTFEIPNCVTKAVTNRRGHWTKHYAAGRNQREFGAGYSLKALVKHDLLHKARDKNTPLHIGFIRIAPRRLDKGDNLNSCFKHIRDGIFDTLQRNDGEKNLEFPQPRQMKRGSKEYAVIVKIGILGT